MDRLERNIRKAKTQSKWIDAGMAFLREALKHNCLDNLNTLADALGNATALSERTLDGLFEAGPDTDDLVARIQVEASVDEAFRRAIIAEFGERILAPERLANRTGDLFAATAP
jgi:hypothetical protein